MTEKYGRNVSLLLSYQKDVTPLVGNKKSWHDSSCAILLGGMRHCSVEESEPSVSGETRSTLQTSTSCCTAAVETRFFL
jgi:hypothetical protein